MAITRTLDPYSNHGDHKGSEDGDEGHNRHVGDIEKRARKRADQADDHADDAEGDGAGAVVGERVEHNAEGQDVRSHDEDEEEDLSCPKEFAPKGTEHHISGVGHVVDVWVAQFELPDYEAGVGC